VHQQAQGGAASAASPSTTGATPAGVATTDPSLAFAEPPLSFTLSSTVPRFTPMALDRADAFTGVLIDDLSSLGTSEPYRMFTARSEYRLSMRSDNSDLRLTERGYAAGVVSEERVQAVRRKKRLMQEGTELLASVRLSPTEWAAKGLHVGADGRVRSAGEILVHSGMSLRRLLDMFASSSTALDVQRLQSLSRIDPSVHSALEVAAMYAPELARQAEEVARIRRQAHLPLPGGFDYSSVPALSAEEREKLTRAQPTSLGQLWSIPGITPSAIVALYSHLRRNDQALRAKERHQKAINDKQAATTASTGAGSDPSAVEEPLTRATAAASASA